VDDSNLRAWLQTLDAYTCYFEGRLRKGLEKAEAAQRKLLEHPGTNWEQSTLHVVKVWCNVRIGDMVGLRRVFQEGLRDALRRGDRYLETTIRRFSVIYFLAQDDPAAARSQLDQASWVPPSDSFHLQHWYEYRARIEIALYRANAEEARRELDELYPSYRRSFLPRVQSVRTDLAWLRGRLELLEGHPRNAARAARALERDDSEHACVWATLLRAGIAASQRREEAAREHLQQAASLADSRDMEMCGAVAEWRLGDLGQDSARKSAEAWMRRQEVRKPERLARLIAPGFPSPGRARQP
jgi:hypothetical protein